MKTTPALLKERRKQRRKESRRRAHHLMLATCEITGLPIAPSDKGGDYVGVHQPSIRDADTASIAALLRYAKRAIPMIECAKRELERRYIEEQWRRRRDLKKAYKALYAESKDPDTVAAFLKNHTYNEQKGEWEELGR